MRKVQAEIGALFKVIVLNMSAKLWRLDDILHRHALHYGGITLCLHSGVGGLDATMLCRTTAPQKYGDRGSLHGRRCLLMFCLLQGARNNYMDAL